ncbi:MAG: hypothetical protein CMD12_03670 [Flavobacteriales bacterium]|nr:hypothetical protein [Flavobacteriales bacterium]|tara:strand:- start:1278 stop:1988 length:711 start_codon:yes stop_codon:yes gene_type:complete
MKALWFLPNALTFLNLFFGCIGIVYGINGDLETLSFFILLGALCDFFDGFFARLLNVQGSIGTHLDSFADLITFGMSPAVVIFNLLEKSNYVTSNTTIFSNYIPFLSFLIVVSSSYRLAKFNLQNNSSFFHGLPTPANAVLIVFLPYLLNHELLNGISGLIDSTIFLISLIMVSSILLISNFELPKLKGFDSIKAFNLKREIFILISISLLFTLKFAAFPLIIILYLTVGLLRIKF